MSLGRAVGRPSPSDAALRGWPIRRAVMLLPAATIELLTETVLDEGADRMDRLFSLRMLLEHDQAEGRSFHRGSTGTGPHLERIANECKDLFISKLARSAVRPYLIAAGIRELDRRKN